MKSFNILAFLAFFILAIVVFFAFYLIKFYNSIITSKNKVENSWGQIDIQLKRRFDLIPNLVEVVKGFASHEKTLLESVTAARYKYMSANSPEDKLDANKEASSALNKLMAVTENYPELKSNEHFLALQEELIKTEDKITFSRQIYNDVIMEYNMKIEKFPGSMIASMFNFTTTAYPSMDEETRTVPKVKF